MKNENITLRALEPEDLDFLYTIENDPNIWVYSTQKEPYSRFALREYLKHYDKNIFERGQLRFIIEQNKDHQQVGTIDIFDFDANNQKAEIGVFVTPQHRRLHYAQQAISLLTKYAKEYLNLHQIYAFVPIVNVCSMATFTKCGFSHTATLNDWLQVSNEYVNMALFQKLL